MPLDQETINDKLNLAILYFKSSAYEKALNLYNELILNCQSYSIDELKLIRRNIYNLNETPPVGPIVHPKLGSLLDQRAATNEKLGQLDKSLKDGEKLIKCEPISCKGYLRVAKVLLIMEKEVEAYKVLQRGNYIICNAIEKYNIVVPEKLFNNLKSQYKSLNRRLKQQKEQNSITSENKSLEKSLEKMLPFKRAKSLSGTSLSKRPKKTLDPFIYLPLEIIELIFRDFTLKEVLRCHLVSLKWYSILVNIPSLYTSKVSFKPKITTTEFVNGVKLIKKIIDRSYSKQIKMLKLRSTANNMQLFKMIELLISEKQLKLQGLDVINKYLSFEFFINKLYKTNWNVSNISSLQFLRLGIKSSLKCENLIFKMMNRLKSLEVIVIDNDSSGSSASLIPNNSKFHDLIRLDDRPYDSLEHLSIVNHPKLMRDNNQTRVGNDTYNPYPPFILKHFPNLTSLCIVSYDFTNRQTQFQDFLSRSANLTSLYLENNEKISIKNFLQDLIVCNATFTLRKLTIREKSVSAAIHLNELNDLYIPSLHSLTYLDVYASSLSIKGLFKLLKIANFNNELHTLFLGNSNYLYFKNDKISIHHNLKISLYDIISVVPNLQKLYINEIELDNSSMKFFRNDLVENIGLENINLKVLDISFCKQIDGIGLMNLFSFNLKLSDDSQVFKLQELIIDGMEFNQDTLKILIKRGYVERIRNDPLKSKWKKYGLTTLVPEL
ncbi:uncharacterized protein AC631_03652 [Debaryomyces fabryi]|uniref:F-box domain-containing protein n=1 Tax=Debaryomyces fabryi TaxID=58627 RepID=A0A0V1PXA7_9ASCO|nr:uncharacterized protein AC631_03652 [Debaryomyces fabryi]KSA00607.1 hypothetical protein AC631_03652 [Debaryomyces fabryi]CUM56228.1 unnamed protein product [Debaryomyces fabryi]